jgi:tetratricopeptide (TPR) repeat protein
MKHAWIFVLMIFTGANMKAQQMTAQDKTAKKWDVILRSSSLETILLQPEKILENPDEFWKTDSAYVISSHWHQSNHVPLDDKDYYNKWLAKLKSFAAVPRDQRGSNQAFQILQGIKDRIPTFKDKSVRLLNDITPDNKLRYTANIHITTGTYAYDFMTDGQVVTDVLSSYFGGDPDKIMNLMTHECFHIAYGYNRYLRREDELGNGFIYNTMLDALQNEGMATYVGYLAQSFFPAKGMPDYQMLDDSAEVRRQLGEIGRLFSGAENAPIDSLRKEAWETGVMKRGYYVTGAHMARTIDQKLGREALLATVVTGPLSFVDTYNGLVEKNARLPVFARPADGGLISDLKKAAFEGDRPAFKKVAGRLKKDKGSRTPVTESRLVKIGYGMIYAQDYDIAIAVFKLNTELFPGSANAYDCLAEAYLKKGDRKKAISLYRKALEVDPQFGNAERMLKELEQ